MAKLIGYLITILGILSFALSFDQIKKLTSLALPAQLTPTILTAAGVVLIIIGIFLVTKSKSQIKTAAEVPIYHGKQIIGYRRN